MIETRNLTKVYRTDEVETTALNQINITINPGEFVSIMGPSGCGKSTLMNILGLLDHPNGGEYRFMGQEVSRLKERERTRLRKESIGFVFQSFNLIDELTVYENIELPLIYQNMSASKRKEKVFAVMEHLKLISRRRHFPLQLSGGQQQRVAVARALVVNPKIILADEPTGNLDSRNGDEVMALMQELHSNGTTIVMVTHSQEFADCAQRVIHLFDGQVVTENFRHVLHA